MSKKEKKLEVLPAVQQKKPTPVEIVKSQLQAYAVELEALYKKQKETTALAVTLARRIDQVSGGIDALNGLIK